ncbi:MAG TPA: maltotransferase domain-containing protein [Microvirga sp.]|jgi:starch synthase (maltosyl-transferring)|nr:maltotransferase domain-containing protein [Microvirga sp.]
MNLQKRIGPAANETVSTGVAAAGPRIYNLFPLLVGTVSAWRAELPRIAGMGFDWVYLNPFHETGGSRSLYAVKDPARLDPRFRDATAEDDDAQLRGFVEAAARHGLKVMTDLVVNHTAREAHLAGERPHLYRRDEHGEIESPFAVDPDDPTKRTVWGDLAELNYDSDQARDELVAYWDAYIARLQGLGVKGFRCDAAYKVPPAAWRALIGPAKARDPSCLFAAETLGCTLDEARATASAGFDYLFNSFAWWNGRESWALDNYEALRVAAPSIAFPENHDMARRAAGVEGGADAVARDLKARYALASFFSAGVLMPIGYEWGYRRPLHVVETTPRDREDTGVDISDFVGQINRLKAEVPALNVEGAQWRLSPPGAGYLALLRLEGGHPVSARSAVLVLANLTGAPVTIDAADILARAAAFGPFRDRTPGQAPLDLAPGGSVILAAGEVRLFEAPPAAARIRTRGTTPTGKGRVIVERVSPELDGGKTPVKRVVGEVLAVEADIFTDGHEKYGAEILYRVAGESEWRRAPMHFVDNDRWAGAIPLERNARYQYTIEAWRDPFATWLSEVQKKQAAGLNLRLETIEGVRIAEKAAALAGEAGGPDAAALAALLERVRGAEEGSEAQLGLMTDPANAALLARHAERINLTRYEPVLEVIVDRLAARFSAWYEIFPRSQSGDPNRHGTWDDVIRRLPEIQAMGFDVLYFPPIHPIGFKNRKGRNNTLTPQPGDPGSVYAIGSEAGGHRDIHPELGSFEEFRRMMAAAHAHGLEIALDFAIQCSPDHPWIKEHPEWFDWRPDGTIKFAENPPKKYEDIVNVHFYGEALPSLWIELRDVVLFWAEQGVRIFRVDNPHTKPIPFWAWMIREVNDRFPDVLFLAEAFTRPKMMRKLAKVGFQQSYTYFTWRNTKQELIEYSTELAGEMGEYYRPNFFANTPDINPVYLQTSGRAGFIVRGTLAATLSSVYGIYNGFELCEGRPVPGKEEYLDSEKYEIKAWDYDRPGNIREHITRLNRIRRENPALWDFRNILFLNASNDSILAYARLTPNKDNCVLVLVNLDPRNRQECTYEVPLWEWGLPDHASIQAEDLLNGGRFTLYGKTHRIALDPGERPVVIWRLVSQG